MGYLIKNHVKKVNRLILIEKEGNVSNRKDIKIEGFFKLKKDMSF